jgi:hypothetical protein
MQTFRSHAPHLALILLVSLLAAVLFVLPPALVAAIAALSLLGFTGQFLFRRATPVHAGYLNDEPVVQFLKHLGILFSSTTLTALNIKPYTVAKTADYTIDPAVDPSGTVFTNRGAAGAVVFTLPAARAALAGFVYTFKVHANQNVTVASNPVDTLVTLNDAAADSLAASTTNEKIGAEIRAFCDGTSWFASGVAVGHTYTIAT